MVAALKSVIVGAGEVGFGLYSTLDGHYPTSVYDYLEKYEPQPGGEPPLPTYMLHICFPFKDRQSFISEVERYKKMFSPQYVVVHSTVPPGTCGVEYVHSPVRGKHHCMSESLLTYTKFFGGRDADIVADYFLRAGFKVAVYKNSRATELAKILETTFFGLMVEWAKNVDYYCQRESLSYTEVWDKFTSTYNEVCEYLGSPKFPILAPIQAPIGGHCVLPNAEFIPEFPFAKLITELNRE